MSSPTLKPEPPSSWKSGQHKDFINQTQICQPEILFIGDSIIEQLQRSSIWTQITDRFKCCNFGIGGDRIEHVLWRIQNGELNFQKKKVKIVVLLVGTNNIDCSSEEIFEGILNLIKEIKIRLPEATIILPTLLPKGQFPNPYRSKNLEVNKMLIQKEKKDFALVQIHHNIVEKDGRISENVLHDFLHLTDAGYCKVFAPVVEKIFSVLC